MTPTEQAARWLADVPRYRVHPKRPNVMFTADDGGWINADDAIAAIARHLAPGDDAVLIDALLTEPGFDKDWREAAAARISALTATVAELQADVDRKIDPAQVNALVAVAEPMLSEALSAAEAEAATLRDRLARMEGAVANLPAVYAHQINTGVREVYDPLQRFFTLESVLSALTDGGSNG